MGKRFFTPEADVEIFSVVQQCRPRIIKAGVAADHIDKAARFGRLLPERVIQFAIKGQWLINFMAQVWLIHGFSLVFAFVILKNKATKLQGCKVAKLQGHGDFREILAARASFVE